MTDQELPLAELQETVSAFDPAVEISTTQTTPEPYYPLIANRPEDALLADWRQAVMCIDWPFK